MKFFYFYVCLRVVAFGEYADGLHGGGLVASFFYKNFFLIFKKFCLWWWWWWLACFWWLVCSWWLVALNMLWWPASDVMLVGWGVPGPTPCTGGGGSSTCSSSSTCPS
uniref:Uncharacterized protein n=1 Tax=Meloidogyne enterolobii TaxID=390850 RepID=A0A6V7WFT8_MELEN|nr:unnamed protein product [Meloidogyne enterolobii]